MGNLSLVVGLYDSCISCEVLLKKFSTPTFHGFRNAAANMLYIFYDVYKSSGNILPITVHCDNDFETMALKHTLGVQPPSVDATAEALAARRLEGRDWHEKEIAEKKPKCGCPFLPNYMDM